MNRLRLAGISLGVLAILIIVIQESKETGTLPLDVPEIQKTIRTHPAPAPDQPPVPVTPASAGLRDDLPANFPAQLRTHLKQGNLDAVQVTTYAWFEHDPTAVRDWLESQNTFEDLQPAISFIATRIAESGDTTSALSWSELITREDLRNETVVSIYVAALAQNLISHSEIPETALPPTLLESLKSGAASD